MTAAALDDISSDQPSWLPALRQAQQAWFRAGVRRGDRQRLTQDLISELHAATQTGSSEFDVLGDDPACTARDWASARDLTDRRLRLLAFVPAALVAGLLAGSAVLVWLAFAFTTTGDSSTGPSNAAIVLTLYACGALFPIIVIPATSWAILHALHATTAKSTARVTAAALPIGAIVATACGIAAAGINHFTTQTRTFASVGITVLLVLVGTLAAARYIAVTRTRN